MSIRLKSAVLAVTFALPVSILTSPAFAQADSQASNDQKQTATSATEKAQSSTKDVPSNQLWTNPHTIQEQPGQHNPDTPVVMKEVNQKTSASSRTHLTRPHLKPLTVATHTTHAKTQKPN